jgi:hypothetical protein
MAAPLYFFPRLTLAELFRGDELNRRPLIAAGVEEVLRDVRSRGDVCPMEIVRGGPGGHSGVMLYAIPNSKELPGQLGYYPDSQEWQEASDRLWIGTDREHPPTPPDLERKRLRRGYFLPHPSAGSGQAALHIAVLRSPAEIHSLPEDFSLSASGKLVRSIKRDYLQLWEDSAEIWDLVIERREGSEIDIGRGVKFCCRVLGVNYRFGPLEQNLLHWIDSENWMEILCLCVDLPALKEHGALRDAAQSQDPEKKTPSPAPGSAKPSPGSPGGGRSTGPAAASCSFLE